MKFRQSFVSNSSSSSFIFSIVEKTDLTLQDLLEVIPIGGWCDDTQKKLYSIERLISAAQNLLSNKDLVEDEIEDIEQDLHLLKDLATRGVEELYYISINNNDTCVEELLRRIEERGAIEQFNCTGIFYEITDEVGTQKDT